MHDKSGAGTLAAVDLDRPAMQFEHHGNQMKSNAAAGDTDRVGGPVAVSNRVTIAPNFFQGNTDLDLIGH